MKAAVCETSISMLSVNCQCVLVDGGVLIEQCPLSCHYLQKYLTVCKQTSCDLYRKNNAGIDSRDIYSTLACTYDDCSE